MLSIVKLLLKEEVGVYALNSHGNFIVDHGKSWKNHGIVFLNICGNPAPKKAPFTHPQNQTCYYYISSHYQGISQKEMLFCKGYQDNDNEEGIYFYLRTRSISIKDKAS